ncbi:hypothetical protein DdX_20452 [Ditylenchus destructor]|uniref:Uncharacterized protein n=1 Tax=Ditylenchus destructor TaxID=166010 RepID=A0AAD4QW59_9BILA|nr:hypothetical protein DdX_20452 [Ditylenchus destructor]
MRGSERVDVMECDRVRILIDSLRRDFAAEDLGENVLVVIGLGRVNRHVGWPFHRFRRCLRGERVRRGCRRAKARFFPEQDEEMEDQIGRLAGQPVAIVLHRRDRGLDRFLAQLLRDLGAAPFGVSLAT